MLLAEELIPGNLYKVKYNIASSYIYDSIDLVNSGKFNNGNFQDDLLLKNDVFMHLDKSFYKQDNDWAIYKVLTDKRIRYVFIRKHNEHCLLNNVISLL